MARNSRAPRLERGLSIGQRLPHPLARDHGDLGDGLTGGGVHDIDGFRSANPLTVQKVSLYIHVSRMAVSAMALKKRGRDAYATVQT